MLLNTCLLLLTPSTHQTHFCSSKSIFSLFILGWIFLIDQARPPLSGLFKSSNNMTTIIPRHSLVISPGFVPYRNSQSMRTKCLVVCVLTVRPSQENVNPLTAERDCSIMFTTISPGSCEVHAFLFVAWVNGQDRRGLSMPVIRLPIFWYNV